MFGPHQVLRPDIAGWRRERAPARPPERPVKLAPDWVCEALSPGTAACDQGDERAIYQRAKVPWYRIVDPTNRSIQVYRLTTDGYVIDPSVIDPSVIDRSVIDPSDIDPSDIDPSVGDRGLARVPPFEAVELDLEAFFPPAEG